MFEHIYNFKKGRDSLAGEKFIALEETSQEIKTAVQEVKTSVKAVDTKVSGVSEDTTEILAKLVDGEAVQY